VDMKQSVKTIHVEEIEKVLRVSSCHFALEVCLTPPHPLNQWSFQCLHIYSSFECPMLVTMSHNHENLWKCQA
jgi:hypothetical protein